MGQFKAVPKMETTEPSVELKLKKGGKVKKMNPGGLAALPMQQQRVMPAALLRRKNGGKACAMKDGGEAREDMKADKAQDTRLIKKAFKEHDAQEHKGGKGTKLKLSTGGVPNSNGGGFKKGGMAKSGIINSKKGRDSMSDGAFEPTIRGKQGVIEGFKAGGKMCKY
jgi:hypothetical protein